MSAVDANLKRSESFRTASVANGPEQAADTFVATRQFGQLIVAMQHPGK